LPLVSLEDLAMTDGKRKTWPAIECVG